MFNLPKHTFVKSVIPKKEFYDYCNNKQKKLLTNQIQRITWLHSLSNKTINLKGEEIEEIQVFHIELKQKVKIPELILLINRIIPYHIIFVVSYGDELYLSASTKYPNPTQENIDVVSDTATTEWMHREDMSYKFELRSSLDVVFNQFFLQIKDFTFEDDRYIEKGELERIIKIKQEIEELESKIKLAEAKVKSTKQINRELEYYQEQKKLERQLRLKKKSLMKNKSGILP